MPSIRKTIFDAYAIQHRGLPLEHTGNGGNNEYLHDTHIVNGLEAGKVMAAVCRLPEHQKSWIEWAYTHLGGDSRCLEKMTKTLRTLRLLEHHRTLLERGYRKAGYSVFEASIRSFQHAIDRLRAWENGYLTGHAFFAWLDKKLEKAIPSKTKDKTRLIIRDVVLAAVINYRHQAMSDFQKPLYSSADICRFFNLSPQGYTMTYKLWAEWAQETCETLDGEALPEVGKLLNRDVELV